MAIKSLQTLVSEAMQEIKTINADEALKMVDDDNCNLIDIREVRELESTGKVENSVHIPRGMLEIYLDPNSALFQQGVLDQNKEIAKILHGVVEFTVELEADLSSNSILNPHFLLFSPPQAHRPPPPSR